MSDCTNCDGRKCMGCVCREMSHDCKDDCLDCCPIPAPVLYPGGRQWAVKFNHFGGPRYATYSQFEDEAEAREYLASTTASIKPSYPDPELWPELVVARITWEKIQ